MFSLSTKRRCERPLRGEARRRHRRGCESKNPCTRHFRGVVSGYRYYNPSSGRWLSRDPINELGGDLQFGFWENNLVDTYGDLNPYLFVGNAPLANIDRFGLAATGDDKKKTCACTCKSVKITYTPDLKDGKLQFKVYTANDKTKRYGLVLHVKWQVDGDSKQCHYGLNEPAGGVTGSTPNGSVDPSKGTEGWILVPQKMDDNIGIRVSGSGQYSIDVNLTQTYACWNAGLDPATAPATMILGPANYVGSGTKSN